MAEPLVILGDELVGEMTAEELAWYQEYLEAERRNWPQWARPEQIAPPGDWLVWLIMSGRGWGKTRTGAEWLATQLRSNAGTRWAVVARTYADARDTCIEGESGLRECFTRNDIETWNRSLGEFALHNGARVKLFSADEPDRLRGPQHHGAWCDEIAAWRYPEAWDHLNFGLRLGSSPRTVATTTPKPVELVRRLLFVDPKAVERQRRPDVVLTVGTTWDNAANLAPSALAGLRAQYEGTRLGRQELLGELLEDAPGALWSRALLDRDRRVNVPTLTRVVVGVDPAATNTEDSDETGIVVVGQSADGDCWVIDDRSLRASPEGWGRAVLGAYYDHEADRVVPEVNNGGDMVTFVLRAIDPRVAVRTVRASRGKAIRAEPVVALYEQGKVHHVGSLGALEDQMTQFVPGTDNTADDRMDALVWAVSDLALGQRRALIHRG